MRGLRINSWRRCIAPGLLVLALMALPVPAVKAQSDLDSAEIRLLVEGLRNGTLSSAYASAECSRGVAEIPESKAVRQLMTTYLEVPHELALAAFCDGLMRAIVARDIGVDTLLAVNREEVDATMLREFGRILRAVYFAHRRATTASAEARLPQ
jgi:hypothetical protein